MARRYNYNNLWKILIDKKMLKKDLMALTGITAATMAKMGKEEAVNLDVIGRICRVLKIGIADVVEYIPEPEETEAQEDASKA